MHFPFLFSINVERAIAYNLSRLKPWIAVRANKINAINSGITAWSTTPSLTPGIIATVVIIITNTRQVSAATTNFLSIANVSLSSLGFLQKIKKDIEKQKPRCAAECIFCNAPRCTCGFDDCWCELSLVAQVEHQWIFICCQRTARAIISIGHVPTSLTQPMRSVVSGVRVFSPVQNKFTARQDSTPSLSLSRNEWAGECFDQSTHLGR